MNLNQYLCNVERIYVMGSSIILDTFGFHERGLLYMLPYKDTQKGLEIYFYPDTNKYQIQVYGYSRKWKGATWKLLVDKQVLSNGVKVAFK
jgi:hypothetical protein